MIRVAPFGPNVCGRRCFSSEELLYLIPLGQHLCFATVFGASYTDTVGYDIV